MNDPLEISTLGSLSIRRGGEPVTSLASRYPLVVNSHWFKDVAGRHIPATLPSDLVAAARERGRARDLDTTVSELLIKLEK
ncbi:MAG: hypothetical protein JSV36_16260 [Anaerolineae bacterium]|nr:MAG: hypothetical protein JSV36_16260 [Anaerolineae bacterium]